MNKLIFGWEWKNKTETQVCVCVWSGDVNEMQLNFSAVRFCYCCYIIVGLKCFWFDLNRIVRRSWITLSYLWDAHFPIYERDKSLPRIEHWWEVVNDQSIVFPFIDHIWFGNCVWSNTNDFAIHCNVCYVVKLVAICLFVLFMVNSV